MGFIIILMLFLAPDFFTPINLINIVTNASINGIAAVGMTLLMISRAFDISIGSIMVLSGAISILVVNQFNPALAIIIGTFSGVVLGLINGLLVAKLKINSFIATLGTMVIYQGITFSITNMRPISTMDEAFQKFATTEIFKLPVVIFYFFAAALLLWFISRFTQLGKNAYAIGGNSEACKRVGIRVDAYVIIFFILSGVFAAFAGVLLSCKIQAASAIFGENVALLVIAGIVLGGVHLSGGVGSIWGVVQGIILIGVIDNITIFLGLIGYYQMFFRSLVLIGIIIFDVQSVKQASKRLEKVEIDLMRQDKVPQVS
jgi:ribose transport system permease protein